MEIQALTEISNWKLEAKLEDTARYFYHIDELKKIETGTHCYVIGRKGTGKTAISEYLVRETGPKVFSVRLSFKNFPFNDLYRHENVSFQIPNQYITLWKYIIYSSIAKLFIKNQNIDSIVRTELEKVYSDEPSNSLPRTITHWTGKTMSFELLGAKLGVGRDQTLKASETSWIERVDILENLIRKHIDDSSYRIVFDELDEDYRDILIQEKYDQYGSLLTSLFKAVQDVKSNFPESEFSILPVIFLRDDIYSLLRDPDKTKWSDLTIELEWTSEQIKRLLAFRLSRSTDPDVEPYSFAKIWGQTFSNQKMRYGSRQVKSIAIFEYMQRSSQNRPRDFIRYIKTCADEALLRNVKFIGPSIVKKADTAFSNYLRSELEDEIYGFLPEIKNIIDVIAKIRKQIFTFREFANAYHEAAKRGGFEERNVEFVLEVLFVFSVIGNQPKQKNTQVFRYQYKESRINFSEAFCVHIGLLKSLQII